MLSLILFRHGKSDSNGSFDADHERTLTERGREAACQMGGLLEQAGQIPDLAISSSATRARDTLKLAAEAGHWGCPIRIENALYESTAHDVLRWIQRLEDKAECLLLSGHEPTWSDLAGQLIGTAALKVSTGAMLRIDFEIEHWSQIDFGRGELRWLLPPKLMQERKSDQ